MSLDRTITELYVVFGGYRALAEDDYCTHCVTPQEVAALRNARLQDLTAEDLYRYAYKAMGTWGGEEEFKHFLPRLLELAAVGELAFPSTPMTKLGPRWRDWPEDERSAIQDFVDAWWEAAVREHPSAVSIEELLEIIETMGFGLRSYLDVWARAGTVGAARHVADIITYVPNVEHQDDLERWLGGPAVGALLTGAVASPDLATEFAQALDAHVFWRDYHSRTAEDQTSAS